MGRDNTASGKRSYVLSTSPSGNTPSGSHALSFEIRNASSFWKTEVRLRFVRPELELQERPAQTLYAVTNGSDDGMYAFRATFENGESCGTGDNGVHVVFEGSLCFIE